MSRFPFGTPFGWYPVAWSFELEPGSLVARTYFGRELVVFRTSDGAASTIDAYCPHLGAHLGVGGRVEEDGLRCPFHGWAFGPSGECTDIPYAKRIPPGVLARSGLPGSIVTIGATSVFPKRRAMDSPITRSTWLCFPVVR